MQEIGGSHLHLKNGLAAVKSLNASTGLPAFYSDYDNLSQACCHFKHIYDIFPLSKAIISTASADSRL